MTSVVVVESPSKARTIYKYLGHNYTVLASYGHVRDLPSKKDCVQPDKNFAMTWAIGHEAKKHLQTIQAAVKGADRLILATDPDREGEAIAWHIFNILKDENALKKVKVERITFNAITKESVSEAMHHPRELDDNLIQAYLARRALDYLVGFSISPILWRKLPGARSAGRVQSVALRLICERQEAIEAFVSEEYWSIEGHFFQNDMPKVSFEAYLHEVDGQKLTKMSITKRAEAEALVERCHASGREAPFVISHLKTKPYKRQPEPPFITSTLQQEAARKLGFSALKTMRIAQNLYEGIDMDGERTGLITYMRTDSVSITPTAVEEIRAAISKLFGPTYLPPQARQYKTKAKNAQEAHEAIRPTLFSLSPTQAHGFLNSDEHKLYTLIWNRTLASQMENARFERKNVLIASSGGDLIFKATGLTLIFPGFLALYQEGSDDKKTDEDDKKILPSLQMNAPVTAQKIEGNQHFTQPPAHYTEASLVKKMEELEIGRPSTYASILSVIRERGYVQMAAHHFEPTENGRLVTAFLKDFFAQYIEYDFTAALEEKLDQIALGKEGWLTVLGQFWQEFHRVCETVSDTRMTDIITTLNQSMHATLFPPREDGSDPTKCPTCHVGDLSLKISRFGPFIGCSNYPSCTYTRRFSTTDEEASPAQLKSQPQPMGEDPKSGATIFYKTGRFGPYYEVAVEEAKPSGRKKKAKTEVKRAGVPKAWQDRQPSLDMALKLLSLPRHLGSHPEDGAPVTAGHGRFGSYVAHANTFAKVANLDDLFNTTLSEALEKLALKKKESPLKKRPSRTRKQKESVS